MAKRSKNNRRYSRAGSAFLAQESTQTTAEKRTASPTLTVTIAYKDYVKTKSSQINLPCTMAELAYILANSAFSMIEELAFNSNIKFLPEKEIDAQAGMVSCSPQNADK